jgi:hypothetical protein
VWMRRILLALLIQLAGSGFAGAFGDLVIGMSHSSSPTPTTSKSTSTTCTGLLAAKVSSLLVESAVEAQELAGNFCPRIHSPSSLEFLRDYVSPNRFVKNKFCVCVCLFCVSWRHTTWCCCCCCCWWWWGQSASARQETVALLFASLH